MVVKASGLAAGKGVVVPGDRRRDRGRRVASTLAGQGEIVLEERLRGPECRCSPSATDATAQAAAAAQDHKRIGDGDTGPNTGGMGAYAPAPVPDDLVDELDRDLRANRCSTTSPPTAPRTSACSTPG